MAQYTRQPPARAPASTGTQSTLASAAHKRQMQQFYLHKLFDLLLDAEFLPLIPSDPVAATLQLQESGTLAKGMPNMLSQYMSPAMGRAEMAPPKGRHGMMYQHFLQKRNDYAQYRQG